LSPGGSVEARKRRIVLPGSERKSFVGAKELGPVDDAERIDVTIVLKRRTTSSGRSAEDLGRTPIRERVHLSREQFTDSFGSTQEEFGRIRQFATEYGLRVKNVNSAHRSAHLQGTAQQFEGAFRVTLKHYEHPSIKGKTFRMRSGPLTIPEEISDIVLAVLGLDERPQARPHFRPLLPEQETVAVRTPPDVAKLYDYPSAMDGTGECIGIVELGGGETESDIQSYFQNIGLAPPNIVSVSVDGATNSPTKEPTGPDGEVMLDIEVAGSVANRATIALYFAPNTDQGFVDAVTTAINDKQNNPSVVSISWGGSEDTWTAQGIQALNQALEDAVSMGITVCVASGDSGSSDGENDGLAHVDFPASSPYVLGCGGTRLQSISNETVWNDEPQGGATGGGISDVFPLPTWQSRANVPPSVNPGNHVGRGIPDISGDADPATGYSVEVDGEAIILGGTSAVAPLWAGLIALINQKLGHSVGYLNPILYESQFEVDFHDITNGNNGAYSAAVGWDACSGWGSPDGSKLLTSILS
jgi:kumamolisin